MSFSGVPPAVRKARKPVTIRPTQETFQPLNAFGKSQIIKTITAIIIRSPKKPSESVAVILDMDQLFNFFDLRVLG